LLPISLKRKIRAAAALQQECHQVQWVAECPAVCTKKLLFNWNKNSLMLLWREAIFLLASLFILL
jgi:hypothetical protein